MKIETKFNIHQKVWFMEYNKTQYANVKSMNIDVYHDTDFIDPIQVNVTYGLSNGKDMIQEVIFATKQELIDSL